MNIFEIAAVLLGLSALFGHLNHRFLRLPHAIGIVIIAMAASLTIVAVDLLVPGLRFGKAASDALAQIDFHDTLMDGMLSFLLFAGALHVNFADLANRKWAIGLMATLGTLISTFFVGAAMWFLLGLVGIDIPFVWMLAFGALISPTDPVAVLGLIKTVSIPKPLETKIAGESLFNDGIGVVVFTIVVAVAVGGEHGAVGPVEVVELFLMEAVGGAVLGLAAGYLAYRATRAIDEFNLEVLITLALVTVTYALALRLHMSGPIAVVVAGLLIGNQGLKHAMSENTRDHVVKFWTLTDEILNSVLFLLIGLEVLIVRFDAPLLGTALLAIPVALAARLLAVGIPLSFLSIRRTYTRGAVPVLVWCGLRGGIAVALALSLPENEYKAQILAVTYGVVVFSIVVQGLTSKPLIARVVRVEPDGAIASAES
ncbi:MAG: cation:proton antiporter [Alphaproteobacteria bacterium]